MKTYILFDLDGTLTDSKIGITKAVQYSLKHFGIKVDNLDSLTSFIGPPLKESFSMFYGFDDEKSDLAINKYREYFSEKGVFENILYKGVDNMLQTLNNDGKKIILATSKPLVYAEKILKHFNIHKYFHFLSGSELDGRRSDKSEVISYAIENCKISNLDDVVMIGDRKHDIIGAKKIGIDSIGVLYGFGSKEELSKAGSTYLVHDLDELLKTIKNFRL